MKRTRAVLSLLTAAVLLATSCAAGAERIQYAPSLAYDEADARQVVRRFLEEQPAKHAPNEIEITVEKISLTRFRTKGGGWRVFSSSGRVAVPEVSTLYWDNVGATELFRDGGWFVAKVFDKHGSLFVGVMSRSQEQAQHFLDAMVSLGNRDQEQE